MRNKLAKYANPDHLADVMALIQAAISLYDRELSRRQRSQIWMPIGTAIIAGLFTIAVALFKKS